MFQIPRGFLFLKVGVNVFQIRNVMRYSVSKPSLEIHFLLPRGIQGFARVPQLNNFSQKMGDIESKKAELRQRLTPLQYQVTQEKGTERPFSGKYDKTTDAGIYSCIVCGQKLFSSETKYDSGCGWPAFNDVLDNGLVKLSKDTSHGMIRTEVQCSKCDAHLGHVFNDGPLPTRKRFCINSASLNFHPADLN